MNDRIIFWKKYWAGILVIISIIAGVIMNPTPVSASNENEIVLNFSFEEPEISNVSISNITYHQVEMNETNTLIGEGVPLLPVKPLKILLPQKGLKNRFHL
jgi:hypothetical protein